MKYLKKKMRQESRRQSSLFVNPARYSARKCVKLKIRLALGSKLFERLPKMIFHNFTSTSMMLTKEQDAKNLC